MMGISCGKGNRGLIFSMQPVPRVLFSRCLGFEACRYNGEIIRDDFVERLKGFVQPVTVCPEVEIGLGVPRPPIKIVYLEGEIRLIQPATGLDLTARMQEFVNSFLDRLGAVDGFVLKSRSPSCGTRDVKAYNEEGNIYPAFTRRGFFGGAVLTRFGNLPVEDEGRLRNFLIRESFLCRLFALARFRQLRAEPSPGALVEFHTRHKLLLLAFSPDGLRQLGRIVADAGRRPVPAVLTEYEPVFSRTLSRPPKYTNAINVLLHALGYFKEKLSSGEKAFFLDTIDAFRRGRLPLSVPVSLLRSWIVRFGEPYLEKQVFFQPYPEALADIADSGKGRDR
ncbi:MAG: DUF523 and DUF1722 domain-containing protein [candidate division WOR-3 bacterium]|nr:DUF523 and DUF1722 domain-containing protein [candidate division WOR-3 bacterium]